MYINYIYTYGDIPCWSHVLCDGITVSLPSDQQAIGLRMKHCPKDFTWKSSSKWVKPLIWLVVEPPTPLKNDGVKVSWDNDIPNIWENKIHIPNHQSVMMFTFCPLLFSMKHGWILCKFLRDSCLARCECHLSRPRQRSEYWHEQPGTLGTLVNWELYEAFGQNCNILQPRLRSKAHGLWDANPYTIIYIYTHIMKPSDTGSRETKAPTVNWPVVACILPMMTWPLSSFTTAACPRLRAAHV